MSVAHALRLIRAMVAYGTREIPITSTVWMNILENVGVRVDTVSIVA